MATPASTTPTTVKPKATMGENMGRWLMSGILLAVVVWSAWSFWGPHTAHAPAGNPAGAGNSGSGSASALPPSFASYVPPAPTAPAKPEVHEVTITQNGFFELSLSDIYGRHLHWDLKESDVEVDRSINNEPIEREYPSNDPRWTAPTFKGNGVKSIKWRVTPNENGKKTATIAYCYQP